MLEDIYFEGERFMSATFQSWPMQFLFITIQVLLILASFALLAGIVWLLFKSNYYGPRVQKWQWFFKEDEPEDGRALAKTWEDIRARLEEPEQDFRELILDATTFMEQVFSSLEYEGEAIGEQLEHLTSAELPSHENVRRAARKAQVMREDKEVSATLLEAEMVLGVFDVALHELGVTR